MGRAVQEEGITHAKPLSMQDSLVPSSAYHGPVPLMMKAQWGFSAVGDTIGIWDFIFLGRGGRSVQWRVLISTSSLYPLDVSKISQL